MQFAPLGPDEIVDYVATGEPLQCAGGLDLEARRGLYISGRSDCYSNVIGLSLPYFRVALRG